MTETGEKKITIWSDGSSLGNPGPGGYGAVIVLSRKNKVFEIGGYERETTNNRMELMAAIEALLAVENETDAVVVNTDSAYVLNGITSWVHGWQKNNWITSQKEPVLNKDLWQRLILLAEGRKAQSGLEWQKVKGHSGNLGNERADVIATSFSDMNPVELFHGTLAEYEVHAGGDLFTPTTGSAKKSSKSKNKGKAYSYLSLVDGQLARHATWAECEARVKGKAGAKFKKALKPEDEPLIMADWGL
jgi:ribonuclease HI